MADKVFLIKATFIGQDGSMGFKKDTEYVLTLKYAYPATQTGIIIQQYNSGFLWCEYSSIFTFMENWTNIKTEPNKF